MSLEVASSPTTITSAASPVQFPRPEAIGQQAAIFRDEEVQEAGDQSAAMYQQCEDHVDDAENGRPRPHITAQIVRDGIPSAEQEVGRAEEEREREEPKGEVTGGDGELLNAAGKGQVGAVVPRSGVAAAVAHRSGFGWMPHTAPSSSAVVPLSTHRSGVVPSFAHRLGVVPTVTHRAGFRRTPRPVLVRNGPRVDPSARWVPRLAAGETCH